LAETRNRKHSKELFKLLRETYEDVQIAGFYESPEDYVAGNLHSPKFESVEEETPFEGDMNIQYNQDISLNDRQNEDIPEETSSVVSESQVTNGLQELKLVCGQPVKYPARVN